jgi:hypothetical protein
MYQAHERLYQHAKQYEENKAQKSLKCKNFDFDGNRLFVPTIIKSASKYPGGHVSESPNSQYFPGCPEMGDDQSRNMNSYQSSSNSLDTVPADEFLYQDARDRESRIRLRNQLVKEVDRLQYRNLKVIISLKFFSSITSLYFISINNTYNMNIIIIHEYLSAMQEIIATASKKKINGLSTVMLRKKAVNLICMSSRFVFQK